MPQTAGPRESRSLPAGPPIKILVVDDDRDAVDMLKMLLEMNGGLTHVAYDGAEAVKLAEQLRPDVVLLDIGMPVLDGYEVARRIRSEPWGANMFLVAISGWGQAEDRNRTRAAGFDHHLVKPADISTIQTLLGTMGNP
jgi:CheY-like chemotaxis protein